MPNWNDSESITKFIKKLSDSIHKFKIQIGTDSSYHAVQDDPYAKEIGNNVDHIQIYVPESPDIRAILHEMGHYIGKRNRIKRVPVLAEIVLCCYMNEILRVIIAKLSGSPNVYRSQIYRPYPKKANLPRGRARSDEGMTEELGPYMSALIEVYKTLWVKIQPLVEGIQKYASPSENADGQDQKEKEFFAFSDMVIPMVSSVLYDELIDDALISSIKIDDLKKRLISSAIKAMLDSCDNKLPLLIADYQKSIGEPTADCFMLAVSGMDYSEYVRLVFQAEWTEWKERRSVDRSLTPSFVEFVSNPVFIARILSIGYAMEGSLSNVKKSGLNWTIKAGIKRLQKYENSFRDGETIRINTDPNDDQYIMQNIRFPIVPISQYIRDCYVQNREYYSYKYSHKTKEWEDRIEAANELRDHLGCSRIKNDSHA